MTCWTWLIVVTYLALAEFCARNAELEALAVAFATAGPLACTALTVLELL